MKVKLNKKQIENIRRELKETERRKYDTDDVAEVFRMLQYWAKSIGGGEAKIQSVAQLSDGYRCRVNPKFRDLMKAFLKRIRAQKIEEATRIKKERDMQANVDEYDRLIKGANGENPS